MSHLQYTYVDKENIKVVWDLQKYYTCEFESN